MTQDKATHLNIKFEDVTFEKQEELLAEILPKMQQAAEVEGKKFMAREWHDPKPQTWQEAYARVYAIDYQLWSAYEAGKDPIRDPDFVWETRQEEHVKQLAEQKIKLAFNNLEIEVSL